MPSPQTIRRVAITGAVASVTAMGAWYGAGLKTQQDYQEVRARQVVYELPVEERIAGLETKRARLLTQKSDLEAKIAQVEAKRSATGA
ncbi:uncharacterized protein K452DRAFT_239736 [Aplosporella prunicola CBS 121167]|uniref:Uncharacterized protein n=1 Tax=Aplosporella prunicola CBS 121167 TaxID=1176127 RepID=A0A6A6AVI9_9PEZI|nr:uncharacterized protein K452DRAFT_239736 [Aplosporella prunicola CBS 121167]KAF2135238.1 hypothetical protein K452DRAFT_239736 [Aplosporella prunicola CBS 121167]